MWEIITTPIDDLVLLSPFASSDNRGTFVKVFEKDVFASKDLKNTINETFVSTSSPKVVRGMHFQVKEPQIKYVNVIKGRIYDVVIDLRQNSRTFGEWYGIELNDQNKYVFCIPAGFAHGFQVVGNQEASVMYQCSGKYDKETDTGIKWNDSELGIQWPCAECIVSNRDSQLMTFEKFKNTIGGL